MNQLNCIDNAVFFALVFVGKGRIDVENSASDFAVACSRARVGGTSLLEDDTLTSLTVTQRWIL